MSTLLRGNEKLSTVGNTNFVLDKKYTELKEIGRGSYGVVVSAKDTILGRRVAIKKIVPMAKHTLDAKHVLREIRLMRHMGKHENVVSLEDLCIRETADELYIVMDLTDSDLHRVLQSKQVLTENHFRVFMHQLFCGVKYLHDNRIIHRDLKPGNLLITRDCKLRITDFGLARERPMAKTNRSNNDGGDGNEDNANDSDSVVDTPMTEHVVTRWYRPPELMLCPDGLYTYAVDMWSCGCILAEMLGRRPLFPGKNFVHQLSLIFDITGSPSESDIQHIRNTQAKKFLDSQRGKKKAPFTLVYPDATDDARSLLDELLKFNPDDRLNIDSALESSYVVGFKNTNSPSRVYPDIASDFEFSFERKKYTKYQLKQMILNEATTFKRERALVLRRAAAAEAAEAEEEKYHSEGRIESEIKYRSGNKEKTSESRSIPNSKTTSGSTSTSTSTTTGTTNSNTKHTIPTKGRTPLLPAETNTNVDNTYQNDDNDKEKAKVEDLMKRIKEAVPEYNRRTNTYGTSGHYGHHRTHNEPVMKTTARRQGGGGLGQTNNKMVSKKQLTVPQSPQFSKRWQQKSEASNRKIGGIGGIAIGRTGSARPSAIVPSLGARPVARSSSAPRYRTGGTNGSTTGNALAMGAPRREISGRISSAGTRRFR